MDHDRDGNPIKPCVGKTGYVELGHGPFDHVAHVHLCALFWAGSEPTSLDERSPDIINQRGILPEPYMNVLEDIDPPEFRLFHEYIHVVGGLDPKTFSRKVPWNEPGFLQIGDFGIHSYTGCRKLIRAGESTARIAECYRYVAQGTYLQIQVDQYGRRINHPVIWSKNIIDRDTMTMPTSLRDEDRLWDIEKMARLNEQVCRVNIHSRDEDGVWEDDDGRGDIDDDSYDT
ncbi:MAG: hypothetical protein Q9227_002583 [Pyrenula ochraceoflavens]